jgi:hypothetical protein
MGSAFWAQPAKRIDREFRDMGARRVERTSREVAYMFPDDVRVIVPTNINPGKARELLGNYQRRYGRKPDNPLVDAVPKSGAPVIDLTRMIATKHAMERFDLMRAQAGITYRDLLEALRIPERVLWNERHDTWLWVRDRIAVVAGVGPNGTATVTTILWAQQELWDQNPRPEKAAR